jgi:IMP dehydrogenase/GMP reductase
MQEGSKDRYFQDVEDDVKKLVPEGIRDVPIKGVERKHATPLVVFCAGMGYCGQKTFLLYRKQDVLFESQVESTKVIHIMLPLKKLQIIQDN